MINIIDIDIDTDYTEKLGQLADELMKQNINHKTFPELSVK